jgi:26S proteasome regulatory subunit T1
MACQTRNVNTYEEEGDDKDAPPPLDAEDIELLKAYGHGPYTRLLKAAEEDIKKYQEEVKKLIGIKESDTGLSQPSMWDLVGDKQMMQEEVSSCPGSPWGGRPSLLRPSLLKPCAPPL